MSDVITQTDLKLFQAREQAFAKRFLRRKFGAHFPPVFLRKRLCGVTLRDSGNWNSTFTLRTSLLFIIQGP